MNRHRFSGLSLLLAVVLGACLATPLQAQRQLSVDAIFHPAQRVDFDGSPPRNLDWLDDGHYLQPSADGRQFKVAAVTGERELLLDPDAIQAALAALPGLGEAEARSLVRGRRPLLSTADPDRPAVVLHFAEDLYHYQSDGARAVRLTHTPAAEEEVSFSPDGRLVAFVRDHDLHVVDVERQREHTLTTDGSATVRNGLLDWVYQEEIYGRGNFRGYWWSPDSTQITFLQLDDADVPAFTIVDTIDYHPGVERWEYPKAGDPNPGVRLGVVRAAGGGVNWVDLDEYAPSEPLIVDVGWTPDSRSVVVQVQDREQTWLDLLLADPDSGETTRLLRETTEAWVNVNGPPLWLADGTFLWLSERGGWKHVYHYAADGELLAQVTGGEWEVRSLHGVDEEAGWIYWSGTERSPIGSDVYRVRLDGSDLTRLSQRSGSHAARFNPGFTRYIDTWSDLSTPPQVRVHAADGAEVRAIDPNPADVLAEYTLSEPELLQVPNRDGFLMEALMIKPPDFDPGRRYPVYQHVYGGPHVQRVRDRWSGSTYMFWQLLAQEGLIVWVLDNRTASGKGAVSTWPVYRNFGESELRDIEDGLDWLAAQPYVDAERIGIEGWSYGGYMVSYALTHSDRFAMGIAGGSVTDWRDYDTIYTERYMLMPQNNAEGYRRSSPRFAAANLSGALLLVHGTMDENVHMQNTLQFAYALQQAGKRFDMMLYPRSRHRLGGMDQEHHRHVTMLDFIRRHLQPQSAARPRESASR